MADPTPGGLATALAQQAVSVGGFEHGDSLLVSGFAGGVDRDQERDTSTHIAHAWTGYEQVELLVGRRVQHGNAEGNDRLTGKLQHRCRHCQTR